MEGSDTLQLIVKCVIIKPSRAIVHETDTLKTGALTRRSRTKNAVIKY